MLSACKRVLSAGEAGGLHAWEAELSDWERALFAGEARGLPVWEIVLSA